MNLKHHIPNQVLTIAHILGKNNVRIAGGAVRDILLDIQPKDFDLATTLVPVDVMDMLRGADIPVLETGLQHGTVTALIDGEPFEITTLRIDTDTDGRHATVVFTDDWQQDAERRDLTINAMFLDMDGNVHDYFGGMSDLDENHVRFVGDPMERIEEDDLRILRYFRFCGRLHVGADAMTLDVISRCANGLHHISGERIWMEMQQILVIPSPTFMLIMEDMEQSEVLSAIGLPTMYTGDGMEFARLSNGMGAKPITVLAALLDGSKDEVLDELNDHWKFSSVEFKALKGITAMIREFGDTFDNDFSKAELDWFKRKILQEHTVRDHVEEFARFFDDADLIADLQKWETPVFPVRGQDLLDMGFKPGPDMGKQLRELHEVWELSYGKIPRDGLLAMVSGDS